MCIRDSFGTMEVVLFPDAYQKYGHLLYSYGPYLVHARVETEHGCVTLTANWVGVLDDLAAPAAG